MKTFAVYGTENSKPIDGAGRDRINAGLSPAAVVIVDNVHAGNAPKTHNNTKGLVLAFDVRTGGWRFNTIPRPGEVGGDAWLQESLGHQQQHWRVDSDRRR